MTGGDATIGGRLRRVGLGMLGAALALALAGMAWLQWRQYDLLDGATRYRNDGLGASFFQLETEHLRLRHQVQQALQGPQETARERLQLRYDIFVSRLGLVDHARAADVMRSQPAYAPTLRRVREFIAGADRLLGPGARAPLTPDALRALAAELDALAGPLHDLSVGTTHVLYERATERDAAVRRQSQQGLVLMAFQCVLLLVLAAVVLRQFRAALQRRERLETLARRLGDARVEAESASRAKSVFLANMSHELRTPFHGLLGMMSLLQETPLTAQQSGFLRTARDSAHHLLAILNDILDISKLESGNLQIAPEPVDLPKLVREVEALMRVQAQSRGLLLDVAIAPGVPRWVLADPTRLKQILFNLLSNAVKFTPSGGVELGVREGAGAQAGQVLFAVLDTGIGMDAATMERVFHRFVQADGTTSRRHGGTGLGLEISRSLARLMGGDLTVASHVGEGSCFTLALPLPGIEPPVPAVATGAPADAGRALRVLVAEDHPVNRLYLEAVLGQLGHRTRFAENGEDAVRAAQEEHFDVVLMDLHMPVMDGFAAARAIRTMPAPRGEMPIVALTADVFQEAREQARQAGMDDVVTKPAQLGQLREVLARLGVT